MKSYSVCDILQLVKLSKVTSIEMCDKKMRQKHKINMINYSGLFKLVYPFIFSLLCMKEIKCGAACNIKFSCRSGSMSSPHYMQHAGVTAANV